MFFQAFFHSPGALVVFLTHFSIGPALTARQHRAVKTHSRRLGRQLVFFKLKNTVWGYFFEAPELLDFQGTPDPSPAAWWGGIFQAFCNILLLGGFSIVPML